MHNSDWSDDVHYFCIALLGAVLLAVTQMCAYCCYSNSSYTGACIADAPHNRRLIISMVLQSKTKYLIKLNIFGR